MDTEKTPKSTGMEMTEAVQKLAPYFNISEMARQTGISQSTIRKRMKDGKPFKILQAMALRTFFREVKDVLKANGLNW